MEEDEETTTTRKSRRKRKLKRGSSPEIDSPIDSEEESNNESTDKKGKKRGRKTKKKGTTPPESEEEPRDLDQVYGVVKQLMGTVNTSAFLERPDDTMYGMSDYYEVISKPMWLKEVERKYNADEYKSATKLVADVRLMLENCYQYWGPSDTLSKRALKLEQALENKLSTLPEHIQRDCSILATHGGIIKEEPDDSSKKSNSKKGAYMSKLMNWVLSGRGRTEVVDDSQAKARQAERQAAEKQLTNWENENLMSPLITEQINSMWEFPVIGQFLQLVHRVLNIDPISHLELERMLLMPQASKTLATLMASMLIPPLFRAKLETGPVMPYSIWTNRLSIKVASWYRILRSKGDSTIEVFDSRGIEPQFWLVMGEENPLQDYQFHELTFLQRVWLLKALCDFLLHNHKSIQDSINNLEIEDLREINLGRDKEGYSYHYFPIFTEVRIYKMAKVPEVKWKNYEKGVENVIFKCTEEEDGDENSEEQHLIGLGRKPLHQPPPSMRPSQSQFRLVCTSLEQVRSLIERLCDADPQALQGAGVSGKLVRNLQSITSELQGREEKMELAVFNVRARMREESRQFNSRSIDYIDPGLAYWKRKEREEKQAEEKREQIIDMGVPGSSTDGLHGDEKRERRSRRDFSLKLLENGLDDESGEESPMDFDDDSEDEWFANKKEKEIHKKKRSMPAKKMKKLAEMPEKPSTSKNKNQELNSPKGGDLNKAKGAMSSEPPIKVKQEVLDDLDDPGYPTMPSKQNVKQSNATPKINKKRDKIPVSLPTVTVKEEIIDEPNPPSMLQQSNVIQTLVPSVNMANMRQEKRKPAAITPDLSKVKRSNSPQGEVVYISDSEDSPDVKPNPKLLSQCLNVNTASANLVQMLQGNPTPQVQTEQTISYAMSVPPQPVGGSYVLASAGPNQGQYLPVNVAQPRMFNIAQQQVQPVAYQIPAAQTILQQPVNTNLVGMQASPTVNTNMVGMQTNAPRQQLVQNPNQKFLLIQPNTSNNANQSNQFVNKGPKPQSFPTTPTTQNPSWGLGGRGTQSNVNFSPRQRGAANLSGIQGQSPRGRGSPRSPITMVRGQRFSGRTPPNSVRTPTQLGVRTPSPMRGRGSPVTANRGGATGPVRNLNFNRSPAKLPVNDLPSTPDLEGTLVVSMTDTGGFGYVIMLPDGGKISLSQAQLSKIRAENGGTLPKNCKVPLDDGL